jgi:hypothetical protein
MSLALYIHSLLQHISATHGPSSGNSFCYWGDHCTYTLCSVPVGAALLLFINFFRTILSLCLFCGYFSLYFRFMLAFVVYASSAAFPYALQYVLFASPRDIHAYVDWSKKQGATSRYACLWYWYHVQHIFYDNYALFLAEVPIHTYSWTFCFYFCATLISLLSREILWAMITDNFIQLQFRLIFNELSCLSSVYQDR